MPINGFVTIAESIPHDDTAPDSWSSLRLSPRNFSDVIWLLVLISVSDVRYRVSQGGGGTHHPSLMSPVSPAERAAGAGARADPAGERRAGPETQQSRVSKYRVRRWRDTPFSPASDFNQEKTMERWKCEVRKKSQCCVNIFPVSCENLAVIRAKLSEILANLLSG